MNFEKKNLNHADKVSESQKPTDTDLGKETIKSKAENAYKERQEAIDAARTFKLTADGQVSFEIHGKIDGKQISAKDNRPLRTEAVAIQIEKASAPASDDRTAETHKRPSEKRLDHTDEHSRKLIEQKERELHDRYGVTFSKPGDNLGRQQNLDGTYGDVIHGRSPTMLELKSIEAALAVSDPAQTLSTPRIEPRAAEVDRVKPSAPPETSPARLKLRRR